jgi:hypothetical protein
LLRQETNEITQIKTKGENNEEEVSNLIMSTMDDTIQKHSRQKKNKKQAEKALSENIIDQEQKDIESKSKIEIANRSPMLIVKDTISKDSKQINKTKKKKKQIDVIEQNENINEDDMANSTPVTQKKKKLAQHTTMLITKDNSNKDSDKINEKKKKKKQIGIIEQEESINEDKKNVHRNETELTQRNKKKAGKIISSLEQDSFTDDYMIAKKRRKEKEILKNIKILLEESQTKNIAQIKTKKKINKKEICDQIMPFSNDTIQKRSQKKRKRQMEETLNENIGE